MSEQAEVLDFSPDFADHVQRFDFVSIEHFDRHPMSGLLVESDFDFAERADAERLLQDIVPDPDYRLDFHFVFVSHRRNVLGSSWPEKCEVFNGAVRNFHMLQAAAKSII